MKTWLIVFLSMSIAFLNCNNGSASVSDKEEESTLQTEAENTGKDAYNDLKLDSAVLERYIQQEKIDKATAERIWEFYQNRDYQYAWFGSDGLTEQTQAFWSLHTEYVTYTRDSSAFDRQLHEKITSLMDDEAEVNMTAAETAKTELELTTHFFDFSRYAFTGRIDPEELQWHIPRKKVDAVALLDSLINSNGENLESWVPRSQQYRLLKNQLLNYYKLEKKGLQQSFSLSNKKVLRQGDSSSSLAGIKQYLHALGDLETVSNAEVFDDAMKQAVMRFQKRHGLTVDGIIGPNALSALNVPVEKRIEQLLINMERMRWLPEHPEGTNIIANIPEFMVHVYEGKKPAFSMDIVVGKAANRTVIFNDKLEYVVFSPYWNVPRSIVTKEIMPAMEKNSNYLASNNMEIVKSNNGIPVIRQKPGPGNALGKVKFIFPNRYSIYFHDTPAKSLFDRTRRAFSHGCIRLEQPFRMAQYLLRNQSGWTDDRIMSEMNADTEKWVKLENPVPVMIVYLTAWVDDDGVLNFREDIYGHDKKMAGKMFE